MQWPPDYRVTFQQRQIQLLRIRSNPTMLAGAKEYYRTHPIEFIEHWLATYDPRHAGQPGKLTTMPFILFPRQRDFVQWVYQCLHVENNGLVEKCRDVGATWLACAISVHLWLFVPEAAIGWGSRKQELVDNLGIVDSIIEKIRVLIRNLPREFWPRGFDPSAHMPFMRVMNPETGASIQGEVGDNIGRGGRKLLYWKDEAQPLTAGILTPTGWQTMADMRIGSQVFGADGRARSVVHINDCGVHDVYRVTFSDGTSVECSPNHLWTVDKAIGKRQTLTLRTHEIAESFRYESPRGQIQYFYRVPLCQPIEFSESKSLPLDPYIVGALLGDGSIATVPHNRPSFTSADPEIVTEISRLLPSTCVVVKGGRYQYRLNDVQGRRGQFKISRASQVIVDAGIAGHRAENKFIPDAYKFASVENRISLLQGLMDTDGSAASGLTTFHTSSAKLASDVQFLVQSLGGVANKHVRPDHRGYRDMYVMIVRLPDAIKPFRLSRKIALVKNRQRSLHRTIMNVELLDRRPVKCITVASDDGLYLTDHCVVTHNSAHYERPEKIEAALGDTTRVQIDISSVNGLGNVFHKKREAGIEWHADQPMIKGKTSIFIFDWSDHPDKTQEWYEDRRAKAEDEGLLHLFAQEVERNYASSLHGTVIKTEWIKAALTLDLPTDGRWIAGLDVADEGGDRNALVARKGPVALLADHWGDGDTAQTTVRAIGMLPPGESVSFQYDSIGVGAGVRAEAARLEREGKLPRNIMFKAWAASAKVIKPEQRIIPGDPTSMLNGDYFSNLRAQAWFQLGNRFERTWQHVQGVRKYEADDLISLKPLASHRLIRQIEKELAQVTQGLSVSTLKMTINKKPDGTSSPNLADAFAMCYWPLIGPADYTMEALG